MEGYTHNSKKFYKFKPMKKNEEDDDEEVDALKKTKVKYTILLKEDDFDEDEDE